MRMPEQGVLPVIHLQSPPQAVEMAGIAKEQGAKGVFLIDHRNHFIERPEYLQMAAVEVSKAHKGFWLGINCLMAGCVKDAYAFAEPVKDYLDGVWVDDASRGEYVLPPDRLTLFGGLGMKGSGYIEDPHSSAAFVQKRIETVDVAVTSGEHTGKPATKEKLRALRDQNKTALLASASGVSAENISYHARYLDFILVASSIETGYLNGRFDTVKLAQLVELDAEARR